MPEFLSNQAVRDYVEDSLGRHLAKAMAASSARRLAGFLIRGSVKRQEDVDPVSPEILAHLGWPQLTAEEENRVILVAKTAVSFATAAGLSLEITYDSSFQDRLQALLEATAKSVMARTVPGLLDALSAELGDTAEPKQEGWARVRESLLGQFETAGCPSHGEALTNVVIFVLLDVLEQTQIGPAPDWWGKGVLGSKRLRAAALKRRSKLEEAGRSVDRSDRALESFLRDVVCAAKMTYKPERDVAMGTEADEAADAQEGAVADGEDDNADPDDGPRHVCGLGWACWLAARLRFQMTSFQTSAAILQSLQALPAAAQEAQLGVVDVADDVQSDIPLRAIEASSEAASRLIEDWLYCTDVPVHLRMAFYMRFISGIPANEIGHMLAGAGATQGVIAHKNRQMKEQMFDSLAAFLNARLNEPQHLGDQ